MIRLFVYGTLREGHAAFHMIRPHATAIESARAKGALYALPEGYPAFVEGDDNVIGDLMSLPSELLVRLDAFEGVYGENDPRNQYDRREIPVRVEPTGEERLAHAYIYRDWRRAELAGTRIVSGDWAAYLREMGLREFGLR